jgi:hypothetical protein
MFFFRFEGYIGSEHLISMRDGCAGFFTEAEVDNSGGIILTDADAKPVPGKRPADWRPPVPMARESYSDARWMPCAAATWPAVSDRHLTA